MSAKQSTWTFDGVLYFYALVKCKKHSCNKCTFSPTHGPYLYKRERVGKGRGRRVEKYIGKLGSEREQEEMLRQLVKQRNAENIAQAREHWDCEEVPF